MPGPIFVTHVPALHQTRSVAKSNPQSLSSPLFWRFGVLAVNPSPTSATPKAAHGRRGHAGSRAAARAELRRNAALARVGDQDPATHLEARTVPSAGRALRLNRQNARTPEEREQRERFGGSLFAAKSGVGNGDARRISQRAPCSSNQPLTPATLRANPNLPLLFWRFGVLAVNPSPTSATPKAGRSRSSIAPLSRSWCPKLAAEGFAVSRCPPSTGARRRLRRWRSRTRCGRGFRGW